MISPFEKISDGELADLYDQAILDALAAQAAGGNMEPQAIQLGELAFEKRAREREKGKHENNL